MRGDRLGGLAAATLPGGLRVHVARRRGERGRGLAGLPALPADRALHLVPCRAVHTFGMAFALDLVWLGPDGRVVRVDRGVAPRRQRWCAGARSVVECGAGRADAFVAAGVGRGYTAPR